VKFYLYSTFQQQGISKHKIKSKETQPRLFFLIVRNQTENEIIRTLIGASTVWIGLYREKLWSDGSTSLFRYWADGEPNSPSGDQCVAGSFNDSGRWSDESCSLSYPFVCASTVWIGLYREKLWSDGSDSPFRYWADGEPNGPSGDQCVAGSFNDSGRWSDESCSLSYPFFCYKPSNVSNFFHK
uniref:C-type lectin domain-containing protein n=1 Tax=Poecilia mexicana TaxID=48701 RepID=A0A3B3WKE1_9TELE